MQKTYVAFCADHPVLSVEGPGIIYASVGHTTRLSGGTYASGGQVPANLMRHTFRSVPDVGLTGH